ncbi:MAG TPA: porin family protein [Bacteroidia bacterium]|nr:porin family protein [Bacteroidia bacterium]
MKKIFISAMILLSATMVSAQDFRIGVKGTFNSTWLFNNNVADQGNRADYAATFGTSFGLASILYFTENVGVSLDILYASNPQKLEGDNDAGTSYESTTRVKYLDLPLLLRISSSGGPYVEFGPQFNLLMGATEDFAASPSSPDAYTDRDVKDYFSSFGIAPVLGFGVDIEASDNWFINIGLRFSYGINDATKKLSKEEIDIKDDNKQSSAFGNFAHYNAENPPEYVYQKTNRAFGGFTLGVIYKLD